MPFTLANALVGAYRFLWDARQDLWSYALLPIVLVAATQTLTIWLLTDWQTFFEPLPTPEEASPENPMGMPVLAVGAVGLINMAVGFAAYVMFAVAWHRRFLVGNEGQTVGAALRWGARQWRFTGRLIAMMLVIAGVAVLMSFPVGILADGNPAAGIFAVFVMFIVVGLVYGRLLLALPAAAKDEPVGFRESIELTKGKSWLMFAIGLLPPFPILGVMLLIVPALSAGLVSLIGPSVSLMLVITLIEQVFSFAAIAAGVTALSIAYRELVDGSVSRSI